MPTESAAQSALSYWPSGPTAVGAFTRMRPVRIVAAKRSWACGALPVFIDVDPRTGNFDVDYAAKHLTPQFFEMKRIGGYG